MAIGRDEVVPSLLGAAPGFQEAWRRHLESWGGEERGIFTDAGEFAHYVVQSYAEGNTAEFPAVFATVETIIREGDEAAREAATIGIWRTFKRSHPTGRSGRRFSWTGWGL